MKGVVLDLKSIDNGDIDLAKLKAVIRDWQTYDSTLDTDAVSRISNADIVITNKVKLQKSHLELAPKLKLICIAATGTNNVDLDTAAKAGITVANVTNYATPSVVEHVFCLILALTRKLNQYQTAVRDDRWQKSPFFCLLDYSINELAGKTLGIIGFGVLGKAVAKLAEALGMQVLIAARKGGKPKHGRTALEELLTKSDVVSLHCPLTPETQGLIGVEELALMKPSAILINTARGGIVDEKALFNAIQSQSIAGAGVDVLSEEPPKHGNPLLDVQLPNLIVTPHIAWASVESRQRLVDEIAENIIAFQNGMPRNVVC